MQLEVLTSAVLSAQRAATSVTSVPGIDWDHYKQALPDVDIDALRQEYDSFIGCVPNVPYIAEADAAKAAADKATFEGVSAYAQSRTSELAELAAEQEDHKLHEYYTVARLFQRFDGLYEKEWLEWRKVNLLGNLRSLSEASDTITDQQKHQVAASMADKMGVDASQFSRSA